MLCNRYSSEGIQARPDRSLTLTTHLLCCATTTATFTLLISNCFASINESNLAASFQGEHACFQVTCRETVLPYRGVKPLPNDMWQIHLRTEGRAKVF